MTEQFSGDAMTAHAYKAYCAGWCAALQAAMGDPAELSENHWNDWLVSNPPNESPLPLFRECSHDR